MTEFVAYVYPGWHHDPYRPDIDEWDLLSGFQRYFAAHEHPPLPLNGRYDDTDPATVARQIELARSSGIRAFTFFTYYRGSTGFVMSGPMDVAAAECRRTDFSVSATWCIRLPHDRFPVPARDELEIPPVAEPETDEGLESTPIELLTLRDLEVLVGPDDETWHDTVLDGGSSARARAHHHNHGVDSTRPSRKEDQS